MKERVEELCNQAKLGSKGVGKERARTQKSVYKDDVKVRILEGKDIIAPP